MKYLHLLILMMASCFATEAQVVARVIDGDTYKVLLQGKIETVRLLHVDAPELDQDFGKAVKDSVTALLERQPVQLTLQGRDLYGRLLADVSINGQSLDSILVTKGWAFFYAKYSKKYILSYYELTARAKSLGVWRCHDPVPPWQWRQLNAYYKRLYGGCRGVN